MGRHVNDSTGVVVNVDDAKDDRFGLGWDWAGTEADKKAPAKKAAAKPADAK